MKARRLYALLLLALPGAVVCPKSAEAETPAVIDVLAEWEELGQTPMWRDSWPWSPDRAALHSVGERNSSLCDHRSQLATAIRKILTRCAAKTQAETAITL